jgi:acyl-CoA thioester hydrolase
MPNVEPFRYLLRVRYGECDGQKIVYNARYGEYVDLAASEFLRAVWGDALFGGGFDYRLVRQVIDWKSPATYDQIVAISVRSGRIGTTSFTLSMELRVFGAEALLVAAETTYVLVRERDQTKHEIPAELRSQLETGASGVIVDHAGAGARSY